MQGQTIEIFNQQIGKRSSRGFRHHLHITGIQGPKEKYGKHGGKKSGFTVVFRELTTFVVYTFKNLFQ
jgi:hypothetical protein